MAARRRVPQRTCVSCRVKTDKRDLLRIVSVQGEGVATDSTGKINGRGAYLCSSCRTASAGIRRDRLEFSLRAKIDEDDWKALVEVITS